MIKHKKCCDCGKKDQYRLNKNHSPYHPRPLWDQNAADKYTKIFKDRTPYALGCR